MKNNDSLQEMWTQETGAFDNRYSKQDFEKLILDKAKSSMRKTFPFELGIILITAFIILYVLITMQRIGDLPFVISNGFIIAVLTAALAVGVRSNRKIYRYDPQQSLRVWLEHRINATEKFLTRGTLFTWLSPFVFCAGLFSGSSYTLNIPMADLFRRSELAMPLIVGFIVGLSVMCVLYIIMKRRYERTLDRLRELYFRIKEE